MKKIKITSLGVSKETAMEFVLKAVSSLSQKVWKWKFRERILEIWTFLPYEMLSFSSETFHSYFLASSASPSDFTYLLLSALLIRLDLKFSQTFLFLTKNCKSILRSFHWSLLRRNERSKKLFILFMEISS